MIFHMSGDMTKSTALIWGRLNPTTLRFVNFKTILQSRYFKFA